MQTRTRIIDADGYQYILEPSTLRASCEGHLVVRPLNPDGSIGSPINLPDSGVRLAGAVFLNLD